MTNLFWTNAWIQFLLFSSNDQRFFLPRQVKPCSIPAIACSSPTNTITKQCVKFIFHPRVGITGVFLLLLLLLFQWFVMRSIVHSSHHPPPIACMCFCFSRQLFVSGLLCIKIIFIRRGSTHVGTFFSVPFDLFEHTATARERKNIFNEFTCISWANSKRMFLRKCTNCSNCSRWYTSDDQIAIFWNKYWEWFLGICRWLFCKSLYQWRDTLVD